MKSILISIKPEWTAKIVNGEKTIEIRKTAPKCELPIDVYIYCTKGKEHLYRDKHGERKFFYHKNYDDTYSGKVVAKFTLKKAEEFIQGLNEVEYEHLPNFALKDYEYYGLEDLMEKACLNDEEITKYAPDLSFYAWHISDLIIFDKPKNLNEFNNVVFDVEEYRKKAQTKGRQFGKQNSLFVSCLKKKPINRAPQSWSYIEPRGKI